jgi:F-type H+-transporting ATPase subunit delta
MTNKSAALRYARALFDVALKEQADLDRVERELQAFAALFHEHPELSKVLLNPVVPVPRKRGAVAELTGHMGFLPIVAKLMTLLAERDRLVLIPDLMAAYRDRLLQHRNVVRAEVTTAAPLADGHVDALAQRLAHATGRAVSLRTRTDPAIIGGLVARIGSTVYDGSVARQIDRIRERLTQSS